MQLSLNVVHDTRFKKKSNKYPVKLRVICDRKVKDYPTIYDLTVEDWGKLEAPRINPSLQKIRDDLQKIEVDAREFAAKKEDFLFDDFQTYFIAPHALFKRRKVKSVPKEKIGGEFDFTPYEKQFKI